MLYVFVVVVCAHAHFPVCKEKKAVRVERSAPIGQFACDQKLDQVRWRLSEFKRWKGRAWAYCKPLPKDKDTDPA